MKRFRTILLFSIMCIPIIGCEVLQQSRIKDEPFIIDNSYRTAKTLIPVHSGKGPVPPIPFSMISGQVLSVILLP
jgi:hypothetical protein